MKRAPILLAALALLLLPLHAAEPACCALLVAAAPRMGNVFPGIGGPILRISTAELIDRGLEDLVVADLNHDGWLDLRDMVAFQGGARP